MKKSIIGILLGMMVMIGCGDDDSKPKAGICEMCNQDSDCEPDLECEGLYDLDTGQPVGEYCIDSPTRVCKIGEALVGLDTKPIATASVDLTTGVAPLTVKFTGSVSEGDSPFTYKWYFGDGESSTEQNPTHIYDTGGTFTAAFTVTDADGDDDSDSVVIKVVQEFEGSCREACEKLEECGFIIGSDLEDCVDGCEEALKEDYEQTMKEIECFIVTPCEDIIEDCFGI